MWNDLSRLGLHFAGETIALVVLRCFHYFCLKRQVNSFVIAMRNYFPQLQIGVYVLALLAKRFRMRKRLPKPLLSNGLRWFPARELRLTDCGSP